MSIIRLQYVSGNVTRTDIQTFFRGLFIPEDHIVKLSGEAFVAFETVEDARQAVTLIGNNLKGLPVKVLLSSLNELLAKVDNFLRQAVPQQQANYGRPPRSSG